MLSNSRKLRARLHDDDPTADLMSRAAVGRMARFLFDFASPGDAGDGYTTHDGGKSGLLNLDLDIDAVQEGIFKPENIAIHVGQNAFNFVSSSIAWLIAASIYNGGVRGIQLMRFCFKQSVIHTFFHLIYILKNNLQKRTSHGRTLGK